jgi:Phytanoyl-CoA dioxygenase (PhyH)
MWWAKRRAEPDSGASTATGLLDPELDYDPVELQAEIDRLQEANRATPTLDLERRLLRLRHLAGIRLVDRRDGEPEFAAAEMDALPPDDPLPEIGAPELRASLIRAGILRHGCLLVRGLVSRDRAEAMAAQIERAFAQRERHDAGRRTEPGYYEEFTPDPGVGEPVVRGWIKQGGGLLAADAPALHFEMMELFEAARLRRLVSDYLGEPALISAHKTTLRKADPTVPGAWHQDGFFMGAVRSLNLWLSLSRCGDEAPGLDLLPRRLDHYLATNTEEAALDYTISQRKVEEAAGAAGTRVIRPIFEPGDALFFDELFLHQTGSDPAMRKPRYAIENWFFGGSGFPAEYAPIAV